MGEQFFVFISVYMKHAPVEINSRLIPDLKTFITNRCGQAIIVMGSDWNAHISMFSERERIIDGD